MNEHIVKLLLDNNQKYEILFSEFPYKNDPVAVFEHELKHYIGPLKANIIPLLAKSEMEKENSVIDYLKFIDDRYHEQILNEVYNYYKHEQNLYKELARTIEKKFMAGLLEYNQKKPEEQNSFITRFIVEEKENFIQLVNNNPETFIRMIGQLRNPKFQYAILNSNDKIQNTLKEYLLSLDKNNFDKIVQSYFTYPLEIEVDTYYKKWIGKDKIHIKFSRCVFEDKYEYAKKALKMATRGKLPSNEEFEKKALKLRA